MIATTARHWLAVALLLCSGTACAGAFDLSLSDDNLAVELRLQEQSYSFGQVEYGFALLNSDEEAPRRRQWSGIGRLLRPTQTGMPNLVLLPAAGVLYLDVGSEDGFPLVLGGEARYAPPESAYMLVGNLLVGPGFLAIGSGEGYWGISLDLFRRLEPNVDAHIGIRHIEADMGTEDGAMTIESGLFIGLTTRF